MTTPPTDPVTGGTVMVFLHGAQPADAVRTARTRAQESLARYGSPSEVIAVSYCTALEMQNGVANLFPEVMDDLDGYETAELMLLYLMLCQPAFVAV